MIKNGAHFWPSPLAKLYRMVRLTPEVDKVVLFIPPLFEGANNTRHAYSKMAQVLLDNHFSSIIFDYSGTGDSELSLAECNFNQWKAELLAQCSALKAQYPQVHITLITCISGALMIDAPLAEQANNIVLWHPECVGKKFITQLKRMAKLQAVDNHYQVPEGCTFLAGYEIPNAMIKAISEANFTLPKRYANSLLWLELNTNEVIFEPRKQLYDEFASGLHSSIFALPSIKFWQASELIVPHELIQQTMDWLNEQ
ncbi:hypothetical protein AADZ91_08030 [Colwelliaceae bacterium 6441]